MKCIICEKEKEQGRVTKGKFVCSYCVGWTLQDDRIEDTEKRLSEKIDNLEKILKLILSFVSARVIEGDKVKP
jgi:hypothetical protein